MDAGLLATGLPDWLEKPLAL